MNINKNLADAIFWLCVTISVGFMSACTVRIVEADLAREHPVIVTNPTKVLWSKEVK